MSTHTSAYRYDFQSSCSDMISREEEISLAVRTQAGDKTALSKLIQANIRFVGYIAKRYKHKPFEEIVSDGMLGLIIAAGKYDAGRNVRFISYAVWWIRQSILFYAYDGKLIRMSTRMMNKVKKLRKQNMTDTTKHKYKKKQYAIEAAMQQTSVYSLDTKLSDGSNETYLDKTAGNISIENDASDSETTDRRKEWFNRAINSLSNRDRDIIIHRYGLNDEKRLTLRELGEKYSLSKERIRQMQNRILKEIKEHFVDE